jgi:hypothetical protein
MARKLLTYCRSLSALAIQAQKLINGYAQHFQSLKLQWNVANVRPIYRAVPQPLFSGLFLTQKELQSCWISLVMVQNLLQDPITQAFKNNCSFYGQVLQKILPVYCGKRWRHSREKINLWDGKEIAPGRSKNGKTLIQLNKSYITFLKAVLIFCRMNKHTWVNNKMNNN